MIAECALTIIVNMTAVWTTHDQATLDKGQIRCGQIYKKAYCLKKIIKVKEGAYRAVCSPPVKDKSL